MTNKTIIKAAILILGAYVVCFAAYAQDESAAPSGAAKADTETAGAQSYSRKGADTCAQCHDEDSVFPVYSIYKTKHAQPADERTPFAGSQCETCHGPGAEHAKWLVPVPGKKQAPMISFGPGSKLSAQQQNQICLDCHRGQNRIAWLSSSHESNNVMCAGCHRIHAAKDPVLTARTQPEACYRCHKKTQSEFLKPSTHPVRFGKMTCSDCHQAHGSGTSAILNAPTVNQTCYTCHAEKRGPLLWEHAPVTEDCEICHVAHGSVQTALLKQRAPLLCQQCHSQFGHPSVPRSVNALPGNNPSAFLLSGSCTNCHAQVHGSNHPSGAKLMR